MIDNTVFQKICSTSIFRQSYPQYSECNQDAFNSSSDLTDSNRAKKSNLSILLNCIDSNKSNGMKEKECVLCLQVMTKGKKFGLLSKFLL